MVKMKNLGFVAIIGFIIFISLSGCIEKGKKRILPETIIPEKEEHQTADEYFSSFEKALEEEGWVKEMFDELKSKTSKFKSEDIKKNPEVQKKVAKIAFDVINREIETEEGIFYLSDVLITGKANCVGYLQIYWIISRKLGLNVGVVSVYKDKYGKYLSRNESHSCNFLILSNGIEILVDLAYDEFDIKHQSTGGRITSKGGVYSIVLDKSGVLLGDLERYDEAEKEFREALRINPEYAEAHFNLGVLLYILEKYEEAEKEFREAININPEDAEAHFNLGVLLDDLEKYEEAEKVSRKAIRINPEYADAHINLGYLLYNSGKLDEAKKEFEIALKLFKEQGDTQMAKMLEDILRNMF